VIRWSSSTKVWINVQVILLRSQPQGGGGGAERALRPAKARAFFLMCSMVSGDQLDVYTMCFAVLLIETAEMMSV
jgi:hypothetical protein